MISPSFFEIFIEVLLIYNVVFISFVQQRDSDIYIHTHIFYMLFCYGLSQDIAYCALCYTGGPCCLFILCIIVCTY